LHVLPAGHRYSLKPKVSQDRAIPAALLEAIGLLVAPGPIRG
jgi:hypothetical protein